VQEKPKILAVVGPTASGKTALAVALARALDGEVICCDSMQIYREMSIGTAKPTEEEKCGVPHHLFDIKNPDEPFSAQEYVTLAEEAVADILSRGKLPVFCGGTGLYLDAFLRGGMPETPGADPALREELAAFAEENGAEALHAELAAVDPESAALSHPNNLRRVIRALEIYRLTGVAKSEWDRRSKELPARYNAAVLGLVFEDRALLYERIERRVDLMLREGLLEETRALLDAGVFERSPTAAAAIGYKELLPYLRGESALDVAVTELKTATRRYAKRQLTWFSAKEYVRPLVMDDANGMRKSEQIVNNARALAEGAWNML
jgi:tRNA dimethylallyltransferase